MWCRRGAGSWWCLGRAPCAACHRLAAAAPRAMRDASKDIHAEGSCRKNRATPRFRLVSGRTTPRFPSQNKFSQDPTPITQPRLTPVGWSHYVLLHLAADEARQRPMHAHSVRLAARTVLLPVSRPLFPVHCWGRLELSREPHTCPLWIEPRRENRRIIIHGPLQIGASKIASVRYAPQGAYFLRDCPDQGLPPQAVHA